MESEGLAEGQTTQAQSETSDCQLQLRFFSELHNFTVIFRHP